ncbi:oxidoreductase [Sediminibacillus massiliensis]|uniref:oxidoreductase n=1 Tax=Sediminibacillus massiliensis TaxID=1926277 RepID=UPI0009883F01|nr:oxidoreductase [Sediminibacillus massiliensis]
MLNIGLIGFGKSTTRYHLPYLLLRKETVNVKKIYSRSKKPELESAYESHRIEFTQQLDDILTDETINLVSICTPPSTHFSLAKLCLENNKHVVVEKPFANTTEEARQLFELANEKGLTIMPFQNRRFDSDFLSLKKVLERGYIGEPIELESHFDYYRPDKSHSPGDFYEGAFYGLGVHLLDQVISLFGKPEKLYYDLRSLRNKNNPEDYYHVELFYGNFKAILKTSHLVSKPYPKFILHGTGGSYVKHGIDKQEEHLKAGLSPSVEGFGVDPIENYGVVYTADQKDGGLPIETPNGDYGRVYDHLYEVIVEGEEKQITDEQVLTVIEILEKGIQGENPKVISL